MTRHHRSLCGNQLKRSESFGSRHESFMKETGLRPHVRCGRLPGTLPRAARPWIASYANLRKTNSTPCSWITISVVRMRPIRSRPFCRRTSRDHFETQGSRVLDCGPPEASRETEYPCQSVESKLRLSREPSLSLLQTRERHPD
jgi:hypothetical protein